MQLSRLFGSKLRLGILVFLAASMQACVTYERPKPGDPYYAPTISPAASLPQNTPGSLYQGSYGMALFNDRKAHNVGDIITVTLSERTVSSKSSGVSVQKDSSLEFGAGPLLGSVPTFRGNTLETNLSQSRDFSGDAGADQSNRLEGNITVTVAEVLPNGALVVRGEKWMTLNRGDEFIRISGIVRPDDISQSNTVPSTRLANAQISYSGTGTLADSQSMGWMSRFFNSAYWPF
ncbi:flagellar basal body L-ring protein FlgH [Marinimicrobium sp. ABcell2]|uniref:flagellar basal body L-ring protein FlgH n=1 Tax=Marinimicrobium sp. ABcell2 TaxID=3069751 RepID=UPI0027B7B966|nr:flagellar basal body L-ring protein FlgH [Marinimicrobium sp. ABcell2]MDQ2077340.1 flagellar basal body L-ring protein FlgH [Marinimicrobium sp. ABcell2]